MDVTHTPTGASIVESAPPRIRRFERRVKGAWTGRPFLEVLLAERFAPAEMTAAEATLYFRQAISASRLAIHPPLLEALDADALLAVKLQLNQVIIHDTVVNEPPVLAGAEVVVVGILPISAPPSAAAAHNAALSVSQLCETGALVVVEKPPSIPVHPCGRYDMQSVQKRVQSGRFEIAPSCVAFLRAALASESESDAALTESLRAALTGRTLLTPHRLDKCTSGLLVLATTPAAAALVASQTGPRIGKTYLALVERPLAEAYDLGPNGTAVWSADGRTLAVRTLASGSSRRERSPSETERIEVVNDHGPSDFQKRFASGLQNDAASTFTPLRSVDDDGAVRQVVKCRLDGTGRTHQLRAHLGCLGCPIALDESFGAQGLGRTTRALQSWVCGSGAPGEVEALRQEVAAICLHAWQYDVPRQWLDAAFVSRAQSLFASSDCDAYVTLHAALPRWGA